MRRQQKLLNCCEMGEMIAFLACFRLSRVLFFPADDGEIVCRVICLGHTKKLKLRLDDTVGSIIVQVSRTTCTQICVRCRFFASCDVVRCPNNG